MDQSIELLTSNPVYMAVAVVLALLILVGVIKKLIKLVLVLHVYHLFMDVQIVLHLIITHWLI